MLGRRPKPIVERRSFIDYEWSFIFLTERRSGGQAKARKNRLPCMISPRGRRFSRALALSAARLSLREVREYSQSSSLLLSLPRLAIPSYAKGRVGWVRVGYGRGRVGKGTEGGSVGYGREW